MLPTSHSAGQLRDGTLLRSGTVGGSCKWIPDRNQPEKKHASNQRHGFRQPAASQRRPNPLPLFASFLQLCHDPVLSQHFGPLSSILLTSGEPQPASGSPVAPVKSAAKSAAGSRLGKLPEFPGSLHSVFISPEKMAASRKRNRSKRARIRPRDSILTFPVSRTRPRCAALSLPDPAGSPVSDPCGRPDPGPRNPASRGYRVGASAVFLSGSCPSGPVPPWNSISRKRLASARGTASDRNWSLKPGPPSSSPPPVC